MRAYETNISVTVLLTAESAGAASATISNMSLGEIAFEIDQGEMIGHVSEPVVAGLSMELVRQRLLEIGNDGSFFEIELDDDELAEFQDIDATAPQLPPPDVGSLAEMTGMTDRELLDSAMAFLGNLDLMRGFEGYLRKTMESPVPGPDL